MGSMADLKYSGKTERLAEEVGYWIAKNGATLVFGAEKDSDSLSTAACRGARRGGGLTVGVTYGKGLEVYEKNVDVVIASGLERGGGRELTLALSCDAIIALNGGSGTLTEIAIAYQANIPVVVIKGTGGWSEKLADQYLDDRKRLKVEVVNDPKAAVKKAISLTSSPKKSQSDLLFLTSAHGNETIGTELLSKLEKNNRFDWIIANEKALKAKKRFVDADLNRSAPGDPNSKLYEMRRSYELINIAKKYRYVIDIHGTKANSGIFTIVTNPTWPNLALAAALPIQRVVIWSSKTRSKNGPISQFVDCGVEIECGPKKSLKTKKDLLSVTKTIIDEGINLSPEKFQKKEFFQVYGKLQRKTERNLNLTDFKLTKYERGRFYPLLVNEYKDIACYKMKRIEIKNLLSYP